MGLEILWFLLVTVLFVAFFFLEGFTYGSGILLPLVAKSDLERRIIFNTVGPVWGGNQVWMITAGGAVFAAFPNWYATLFSGFYLPLSLILVALILRGIALEFRSKDENSLWRALWDYCFFIGSLIAAFVWGVAMANLLKGVPIDANMHYVGGFFNLFTPFTLIMGLLFVLLFSYHGALFLALKTTGEILSRIKKIFFPLWLVIIANYFAMILFLFLETDALNKTAPSVALTVGLLVLGGVNFLVGFGRFGFAFIFSSIGITAVIATIFTGLFPRVMVSSLDPEWSLTIFNSASGPVTLKVMAIVAIILVPIIIAYQAWSYWIFRKPVDLNELEY
ncbi:MAG: cytochrome d ubiquinol oxidase subunit II [Bacillota bacterium]